ncbi:hypothetical protein [Streptomyces sp. NPDC005125]
MRTSSDRRLVEAAQHAADGMITQYLAAAPDLLSHYQTAEPGPRELLEAAMDARRLGHPLSLPRSFLKKASEGYLTPTEWELLPDPDNWVDQALATLKQPVKGTPGPLHAKRRERGASDHQGTQAEQAYVLADFLDQHGHKTRRASRVPGLFWQAALDHWEVAASRSLAGSADARGLIKFACELWAKVGDYLSVADRLADANRLSEALPWYKRAADGGDHTASKQAADRLAEADRLDEALPWYKRTADGEWKFDACMAAADRLAEADRLDEALPWYKRAAEDADRGMGALALRSAANCLTASGQVDAALTWYERAAEGGDGKACMEAADDLADAGRLDDSLPWYERAANAGTGYALGKAAERLTEAGRLDDALPWYERDGSSRALRKAADRLAAADRSEEALAWSERADTIDKEARKRNFARILKEAEERNLVRKEESHAGPPRAISATDAHNPMGEAATLAIAGQTAEAVALYEGVGTPYALYLAAEFLSLDEALPRYERAAAGGFAGALRQAATRLTAADRLDEALLWCDRYAEGDYEAGSLLHHAGQLLVAADRLDEALARYERAAATQLTNPLYATEVMRRSGRSAAAEQLTQYGWDPDGGISAPWTLDT